jgi:hypothetical protein
MGYNKKTVNPTYVELTVSVCDPAGIRTQDHYIKSVMLYQLSYGIIPLLGGAKIEKLLYDVR